MTTSRLIARGVSVQVVGRFASVAVSLVTLSLTTRYLGAEGYGLLVTAVLFTGVYQAFTDLEIGTIIVRRIGGGRGDLSHLVGVNLGASLVYAIPLSLIAIVSSLFVYPGDSELHRGIAILSVGLGFTVLSSCYRPPYELAIRFGALSTSDFISRFIAMGLTILIVSFDLGITAVFFVQIVPNAVELLMLSVLSRRYGSFRPIFHLDTTVGLVREALPLAAVNLIGILYYRADGVLLSVLSDDAEVGAYGLGYRLASNLGVISAAFLSAVIATMVRSFASGRDAFRATVTNSLEFMLVFAVPIATLGLLVVQPLLQVLAGDPLASLAVLPTQALLVATALAFLNAAVGQALVTSHQQRPLVMISAVSLVINICLNIVLIPRYGAVGAGVSLVITEVVSVAASQFVLYRSARVVPPVGFALRLIPAILTGAVAWYLLQDRALVLQLAVVALGYFGGLAVFGPVSLQDMRGLMRGGRRPRMMKSRPGSCPPKRSRGLTTTRQAGIEDLTPGTLVPDVGEYLGSGAARSWARRPHRHSHEPLRAITSSAR